MRKAERLNGSINEKEMEVSRPVKKTEFRIRDIDDSVTPVEIAAAVAAFGRCDVVSLRIVEVRCRSHRMMGSV